MEYIQLQSYQNMLHYRHLRAKPSNQFLLVCKHQDLLHMSHSLIGSSYLLNKHH